VEKVGDLTVYVVVRFAFVKYNLSFVLF